MNSNEFIIKLQSLLDTHSSLHQFIYSHDWLIYTNTYIQSYVVKESTSKEIQLLILKYIKFNLLNPKTFESHKKYSLIFHELNSKEKNPLDIGLQLAGDELTLLFKTPNFYQGSSFLLLQLLLYNQKL